MSTIIKLLFAFGMGTSITVSMSIHAEPAQSDTEWIVVLNDPRPARLQGWQRSNYGGHYNRALELKRAGQRVANQYNLVISTEWFIESLNVYCLVALFNENEQPTLESLRADKNVKWVQPSNSFNLLQTPQPKRIPSALLNPPELRLPESINGKGVVVALVDSAVDGTHPDVKEGVAKNMDLVAEEDKESNGEAHGTAIASVIVADQQSNLGVTGVASGAKLKAYRGCWETSNDSLSNSPNCSTLSLARALDAVATSKPDILNLSLSGPKDELLDQLITQITANGTHVVTAFDPSRAADNRFPSTSPGVLTVQADSLSGNPAQVFSAPGTKVVASPGKRADLMHGHSIAAAYTSGVLALCSQIEAQLEKEICGPQVLEQLQESKINNVHSLISKLAQELNSSSP